jgi:acyl-CoA synthetase (AMP-forming)/AMP-acid ligase II
MGYWRQPDATSEVFQARIRGESELSYLRTGDLGFLHEDNLYITGRKKDLIIIRGQNYYPQDIEATVRETNEALASNGGAVFSIDIEQEERLVVVQEVDRIHIRKIDYIQTVEQIRHSVLKVHGLKVYSIILVKPLTIPKTTSGKIKRNHCKLQYLNNDYAYLYSWKEK